MQKIKMARGVTLTFEEGCNKYSKNCLQRNLRGGATNPYRQSYKSLQAELSIDKQSKKCYNS